MRKQQCRIACGGGGALSRSTCQACQPSEPPAGAAGAAMTNNSTIAGAAKVSVDAGSML